MSHGQARTGSVRLDPGILDQIQAASRLHAELLPDSPISRLGRRFREDYYYSELPRHGLIACELYRSGEEYVGFVVWTPNPFAFMEEGRRAAGGRLLRVLAWSILGSPKRLGIVLGVARVGRRRRAQRKVGGIAEILSMGVRPEYAQCIDSQSGLRVPHLLFEGARTALTEAGSRRVQMIVRSGNMPALLFFHSCGARRQEGEFVPEGHVLLTMPLGSGPRG